MTGTTEFFSVTVLVPKRNGGLKLAIAMKSGEHGIGSMFEREGRVSELRHLHRLR